MPASAGFASNSHLRGVTPLVLLLKRSGNISARSLTVVVRSRSVWIAETPLVLCEPTMARLAMRILRSAPSSTRLMRRIRSSSAGIAGADGIEKAPIDLEDDLQMARQHHPRTRRAAISRALRAAGCDWCRPSVRCVRSQAWSQPRCASSSRIRINSGTAIVGCVSLS